jgi:hypothetical protein
MPRNRIQHTHHLPVAPFFGDVVRCPAASVRIHGRARGDEPLRGRCAAVERRVVQWCLTSAVWATFNVRIGISLEN